MTEIEESSYEKYDLKSWLDIPKSSNWIQALDPEVRRDLLFLHNLKTIIPVNIFLISSLFLGHF
jgi:hypothetical protein